MTIDDVGCASETDPCDATIAGKVIAADDEVSMNKL
jgi:hypothetical protein